MNKMILLLTMLTIPFISAAAETPKGLDGVAAVVGDSVILQSDVAAFVQMKLSATGGNADMLMQNMMYAEALDELIDGLVLLVHTAKDTNVVITQSDISQQVDSRINGIMKQNKINEEQLAQALQAEQGISFRDFRDKIGQQVQQELVRQRVQQFYLSGTELSRNEVREFYTNFRDSLPPVGESVKLQKLEIALQPDSILRQQAFASVNAIRQRSVENGEDFLSLAEKYSTDKQVATAGDLGFVSKGTLSMIRLEQIIFTLQPGEVSQPIETRLGFHLIKVLERRDNRVHALHILIPVQPSDVEVASTTATLDSIRLTAPDFETFGKAVADLSTEPVSRAYKGELEWQNVASLDKTIRSTLPDMNIGTFSTVISQDNTLFLYRISQYEKNRAMALEDDWTQIEQFARQMLIQERLAALVKTWRKDIFIQKYQ